MNRMLQQKINQQRKKVIYPLISVVACTNRPQCLNNIISNFIFQKYSNKELIVVINNDDMKEEEVKEKIDNNTHFKKRKCKYQILKVEAKEYLSKCLNVAIKEMNGQYFAKMDDDDYYSPDYLIEAYMCSVKFRADLVGKSSFITFVPEYGRLFLRFPTKQTHTYTDSISGATIFAKKAVLDKVKFDEKYWAGSDAKFIKACVKNKFRIFCSSNTNLVVIRHKDVKDHTWKKKISDYLRGAVPIVKPTLLKHLKKYHKY